MESPAPAGTSASSGRRPWRAGTKVLVVLWIVLGLLWLLSVVALVTAQDIGTACLAVIALTYLLLLTAALGVATLAYVVYRIVAWRLRRRRASQGPGP